MSASLTYNWTEKIFDTRRKNKDFKAYRTDTHLTKADDGMFTFTFLQYNWEKDETSNQYKRSGVRNETPLVSVTPGNVMTLLAPDNKTWPSAHHMTIRNRLQDITGLDVFSDTGHHRNKEMAIRVASRFYGAQGWEKQAWCANTRDKTIPYKADTQFQVGLPQGRVECLNVPKDIKNTVKQSAIQSVKAETAVIRKLAMVMLRVGFEEHIEKKLASSWYGTPVNKKLVDIDYKNPTGDDALAVLAHGIRIANKPDTHVWQSGNYTIRSDEERARILRQRVLDNGMKALRQHIYQTTGGYEQIEV